MLQRFPRSWIAITRMCRAGYWPGFPKFRVAAVATSYFTVQERLGVDAETSRVVQPTRAMHAC